MKTKEELKQIKTEYTELSKKLAELSEEELKLVVGGGDIGYPQYSPNSDTEDII